MTRENRKHEWNNLVFLEEAKRNILIFYFEVIRRRLLGVLIECFGNPTANGNAVKGFQMVKKQHKDNI